MKFSSKLIFLVLGTFVLGLFLGKMTTSTALVVQENFSSGGAANHCRTCQKKTPCGCATNTKQVTLSCPQMPDMSKYVLKATVPPCPSLPDLSKYMLKTECPPYPDMSKYVLKSSVPKCPPCIASCNKPCKIGDCPPCPRPRCPVVKCPEPRSCQPCPNGHGHCPEPNVSCKTSFADAGSGSGSQVRPMLASTANFGF